MVNQNVGARREWQFGDEQLPILQFNAKMSPKRFGEVLEGEEAMVDGTHAKVIAFSDPSLLMLFRNHHGYDMDINRSRPIAPSDHPSARLHKQKEYDQEVKRAEQQAKCRARRGLPPLIETTLIEPVSDLPLILSKVFFCVHKSIPLGSWSIDWHDDENMWLSATLFLETSMGQLAIHNVHNPNTKEHQIEIEPLIRRLETPVLHIVVGDFNLHDESWGGRLFKPQLASAKARDLRISMEAASMDLVTKKGTVTYTRGLEKVSGEAENVEDASLSDTAVSATKRRGSRKKGKKTRAYKKRRKKKGQKDTTASTIYLTYASKLLRSSIQSWGVDKKSLVAASDHRCIRTILKLRVYLDNRKYYNYKKGPIRALKKHVDKKLQEDLNHREIKSEQDVSKGIADFTEIVIGARDKYIPYRLVNPSTNYRKRKGSNAHKRNLVQPRDTIVKPSVSNQQQRWEDYKLKRSKERAKYRVYTAKTSQASNGPFALAKMAMRNSQPKIVDDIPTLDEDTNGVTYQTAEEQHVCFRKMWAKTSDEPSTEIPFPKLASDRNSFGIKASITKGQVQAAIKKLSCGKAAGIDEIAPDIIKITRNEVAHFLAKLFQACLDLGVVPDAFKRAITVILRKQGKDTYSSPKSWRPIALLSVVGKLYERILTDFIVAAVIEHNLLPATQYGAPGGSTSHAIKDMLTPVYHVWAKRRQRFGAKLICKDLLKATMLGVDMASAYDGVPMAQLLQELADKGFPVWLLRVIHSFLSNRRTYLKLPRSQSQEFHVNIGIPQGSPLSPILFLFFTAPLLDRINRNPYRSAKNRPVAYVDDTYLVVVSKSYKDNCIALAEAHKEIMAWSAETGITFSPKKYNLMHFKCPSDTGPDPTDLPDIPGLKNNPACLKTKVKVLGVVIDNKLTWEHHVSEIEVKVKKSLAYMRKLQGPTWGMTLMGCRRFFIGKIRPTIAYGCMAWFVHSPQQTLDWSLKGPQMKRLEKLQYQCLKEVSGALGNTTRKVLEKELHLEDIKTFLHRSMISARAKSLKVDPKSPYGIENIPIHKRETGMKSTPYEDLDREASILCNSARTAIQESESESKSKSKNPKSWKDVWLNPQRRKATINRLAKQQADGRCAALWEVYRRDRRKRYRGRHQPQALEQPWGPESLTFYKGMSRAQSTMLLHCRTEFIGLNYHLNSINANRRTPESTPVIPASNAPGLPGSTPVISASNATNSPDPKDVVPATCSCGHARQTVFHMFLDCPDLREARRHLEEEVMFLNMKRLLTTQGKFAADWAISYFKLDQFELPRADSMFAPRPVGN
ncbi:hypothetical protein FSST1_012698 [Fusarium sambucinum]